MKIVNQIKLNINHTYDDLINQVINILHIKKEKLNLDKFVILKKSIDARNKNDIKFVYNVAVDFDDKNKFNPIINDCKTSKKVFIIGFGPAGIFAAYILALNGIKPIVIERGKSIDDRIKDVDEFFKDVNSLNENSNVCFGEGGAGAFSDGKLNTNNKDRQGIYKFILETFVKFGASPEIIYENFPHIGTDKLINIIKNIRDEIIKLGGEVKYNIKFTYDEYKNYARENIPIILAIGNSSRDTFRDLIKNGFNVKPKPIAVGFRIAHKQKLINEAQYGDKYSFLPPAIYKLTYDVKNGHSVYSFCMCPGGYIINSSNFKGYLSINGMSYSDRRGEFANSAIVETITIDDVKESLETNSITAIQMIEFQEIIEKKAYEIEKGCIPYFSKNIDIKREDVFKGISKYNEKIFDIYENIGFKFSIKNDIMNAIEHFNKIIKGFNDNFIIAGVETRTSSPVSLDRNEKYMCNIKNFYPCGEGLGHGGGIISSAADGVKVALYIVKNLEN